MQQANGERWIKAEDFYQSLFTTALQPDEILTEVVIPPPEAHTGCAFLELARRHGDYAQAGVAALVTLDDSGACTAGQACLPECR
ncbi:MAG: FAD binding domain-containing protein [Ardenticatenaceae bacterium]|nr:FAD binding domain-containing protein [Ardenticatenaceae bacterium]